MISDRHRDEVSRLLRELHLLCDQTAPGERLPPHRELMRRYRTSERLVLRALDQLCDDGMIERRSGVGTFVTNRDGGSRPGTGLPICDPDSILVIARPDRSFFDRCLEVLHRLTMGMGRRLVIHPLTDDVDGLTLPPPARPAGVVLFHQRFAALGARLHADGVRVVLVGAPDLGAAMPVPCVHGDHEHGGYLATHHLLGRGHRRIAMLAGAGDLARSARWRGHQRAIAEAYAHGLTVATSVITQEDLARWENDPRHLIDWWQGPHGATGVACWNDREATRLLGVLRRAHLHVPDDVGLVGYDDLPECRVVSPPLTTIDQQIERQIQAALDLITTPDGTASSHLTVVPPTLIPRRSSDARVR